MEDEDISLGLNSNEELVSVQGQDGQQYVVLEVIQLEVFIFCNRKVVLFYNPFYYVKKKNRVKAATKMKLP